MLEGHDSPQEEILSRWQIVLREAKRGAWFGAKWMALILTLIMALVWGALAIMCLWRISQSGIAGVSRGVELLFDLFKGLGIMVLTILYCSLMAAVVGSIISGIAALFPKRTAAQRQLPSPDEPPLLEPLVDETGN